MAISDANYNYCSESHVLGNNVKSKSIFKTPLLFVGLGPQGLLDSDSLRSPTSPLDVTLLSNQGNPLRTSSPDEGNQRSWDCNKVGLSIIDSLKDGSKFSGNILLSSECKKPSLSLSPKMIITKAPNCKPCIDSVHASKSLPNDFFKLPYTQNGSSVFHKGECGSSNVLFEIGETMSCSNFDSNSGNFGFNPAVSSSPHFIGGSQKPKTLKSVSASSSNEIIKCLSASEIENSEDYTCVISHGPNPKTTHIFCDCILEIHADDVKKHYKNEEEEELGSPVVDRLETPNQYQYPSSDFLSFCFHCNKKLEEGKDIYMYRGEKAFCSLTCRALEIMIDEELDESNAPSEKSLECEGGGKIFEAGIFTATT